MWSSPRDHRREPSIVWLACTTAVVLVLSTSGCGQEPRQLPDPRDEPPPVADPVAETPHAEARTAYFRDADFRRVTLTQSLQNPDNGYSRDRLVAYGFGDAGWELLPLWNPRSVPYRPLEQARASAGEWTLPPAAPALWDGVPPTDDAGWQELGRRVFTELPLRPDDSIARALTDPQRAAALGLEQADDGTVPGVVVFADVDGRARVGITCALCHSAVHRGRPWPGLARRNLDFGAVRLDHHRATQTPLDPELLARMKRWGPGRADITGDDDEDPVAIPDLWRLLELSALTQAGTIRLNGPRFVDEARRRANDLVVLAIRQETQVIQANGERARPPRELAWALARFVSDLEPPPRPPSDAAGVREGRALFGQHCRRCHDGPAFSGAPVAAEAVGTDRALADSRARGTGKFRPAPLVAVVNAAPYFHDGTVPTLADLLDPARLRPEYRRGVRQPGPVPGHAFGTELPADQRQAMIAYLGTL